MARQVYFSKMINDDVDAIVAWAHHSQIEEAQRVFRVAVDQRRDWPRRSANRRAICFRDGNGSHLT
jgi:hypothetical protein